MPCSAKVVVYSMVSDSLNAKTKCTRECVHWTRSHTPGITTPALSTKRFSGTSGGSRKSDGWTIGLRGMCDFDEVVLIDDRSRLNIEGRLKSSATVTVLYAVRKLCEVDDESNLCLADEEFEGKFSEVSIGWPGSGARRQTGWTERDECSSLSLHSLSHVSCSASLVPSPILVAGIGSDRLCCKVGLASIFVRLNCYLSVATVLFCLGMIAACRPEFVNRAGSSRLVFRQTSSK